MENLEVTETLNICYLAFNDTRVLKSQTNINNWHTSVQVIQGNSIQLTLDLLSCDLLSFHAANYSFVKPSSSFQWCVLLKFADKTICPYLTSITYSVTEHQLPIETWCCVHPIPSLSSLVTVCQNKMYNFLWHSKMFGQMQAQKCASLMFLTSSRESNQIKSLPFLRLYTGSLWVLELIFKICL